MGLILGGFLLGQVVRPPLSSTSGNNFTVPVEFSDEVTLSNCGTKASVVIPAISGGLTTSGDMSLATSVTVTGIAKGDVALVSWAATNATDTLQELKLTAKAYASTTDVAVVIFQNTAANTSTASKAGTLKVCYFD